MNARSRELVAAPLRMLRRSVFWWSLGLALLVAVTVAVWPAFRGSSGISEAIDQLPTGVVQAFGLQDFGTPAGYLRGNLYELFIPLVLAGAAIGFVNGQTAADESSGRLELYFAQPLDRRAIVLGRAAAAFAALLAVTAAMTVVQFGADALVDLRIDPINLLSTIVLCALLASLHGSLALAIAGVRPRPALVLGIGISVALAGYLVAALFPLSPTLEPLHHLSPWDWALGGDPLMHPSEPWRFAALIVATILLTVIGVGASARRDAATA